MNKMFVLFRVLLNMNTMFEYVKEKFCKQALSNAKICNNCFWQKQHAIILYKAKTGKRKCGKKKQCTKSLKNFLLKLDKKITLKIFVLKKENNNEEKDNKK